jgi:hypothetical protein
MGNFAGRIVTQRGLDPKLHLSYNSKGYGAPPHREPRLVYNV